MKPSTSGEARSSDAAFSATAEKRAGVRVSTLDEVEEEEVGVDLVIAGAHRLGRGHAVGDVAADPAARARGARLATGATILGSSEP